MTLMTIALITCPAIPRAHAAWQQTEFLIGAAPWSNRFDAEQDTATFGRQFRAAARAGINLMFPGVIDNPYASDFSFELRTASALGVHIMKPYPLDGTATPLVKPADVSTAEWDNFIGYWVDQGAYAGDHISPPTSTSIAAIEAIHNSDKIAYANETGTVSIWNWMQADSVDHPDIWSYEFYLENYYENPDVIFSACDPQTQPACLHFPLHDYHQMVANPAMVMGFTYVSGQDYNFDEATKLTTLMPMAFLPVALGARGILWSQWNSLWDASMMAAVFSDEASVVARTPAVVDTDIPTPWFWELRRINRYLRQVVGPAIMKCDYLFGLNHAAWTTGDPEPFIYNEPRFLPGSDKPFFHTSADIPDSFLVSIWKPRGAATADDPDSTFYLFIVNKSLRATCSGTLVMNAGQHFSVAAAPSAMGYESGSGYAPVTASHTTSGAVDVTSFTITLTPGEGRLYKVVPSSAAADLAKLDSPAGGESWSAGQTKTISWSGISSGATVRLALDEPRVDAPGGPVLDLAGPVSGGSCTVTVPAVSSSRARIEVSGYTSSGAFTRVTHAVPVKIASGSARENVAGYKVSENVAGAYLDLATTPLGQVRMLYTGGPTNRDFRARLWDVTNSSEILPDRRQPSFPAGVGYFGVSPAMVIDSEDVIHVAYSTVFAVSVPDSIWPLSTAQVIRYFRKTASGWSAAEIVAPVGNPFGGCAIAIGLDGEPLVAYNAGSFGEYRLRVAKRDTLGGWTDLGLAGPVGAHDPSIALDSSGNVWLTAVAKHAVNQNNLVYFYMGTEEPDSFQSWGGILGVTGFAPMQVGADDFSEVACVTAGPSSGSQILMLRRLILNEGNAWQMLADTIDTSAKGVSGLAITRDEEGRTCVAYASNGVLREAIRNGSNNWTIYDVVRERDVNGPIGFSISPGGSRWYSYWDKARKEIWTAYWIPQGSYEEEPDDPGEMLPAITFNSANPVVSGGAIRLALRLPRSAEVDLSLYDVAGRRVSRRAAERLKSGPSHLSWSPPSHRSGVYFLRVRVDGRVMMTKRLVLLD